MSLRTYLNFGGNCADAFKFYEKNLGAKINMLMTFDQMPGPAEIPSDLAGKVLHASIDIAGTTVLGSDVPADRFQPIRSVYLCLSVDSDAEAESLFKLLSEGGEVYMPMQETFFASRFGQLRDRFGTSWMILHDKPMGPPQP